MSQETSTKASSVPLTSTAETKSSDNVDGGTGAPTASKESTPTATSVSAVSAIAAVSPKQPTPILNPIAGNTSANDTARKPSQVRNSSPVPPPTAKANNANDDAGQKLTQSKSGAAASASKTVSPKQPPPTSDSIPKSIPANGIEKKPSPVGNTGAVPTPAATVNKPSIDNAGKNLTQTTNGGTTPASKPVLVSPKQPPPPPPPMSDAIPKKTPAEGIARKPSQVQNTAAVSAPTAAVGNPGKKPTQTTEKHAASVSKTVPPPTVDVIPGKIPAKGIERKPSPGGNTDVILPPIASVDKNPIQTNNGGAASISKTIPVSPKQLLQTLDAIPKKSAAKSIESKPSQIQVVQNTTAVAQPTATASNAGKKPMQNGGTVSVSKTAVPKPPPPMSSVIPRKSPPKGIGRKPSQAQSTSTVPPPTAATVRNVSSDKTRKKSIQNGSIASPPKTIPPRQPPPPPMSNVIPRKKGIARKPSQVQKSVASSHPTPSTSNAPSADVGKSSMRIVNVASIQPSKITATTTETATTGSESTQREKKVAPIAVQPNTSNSADSSPSGSKVNGPKVIVEEKSSELSTSATTGTISSVAATTTATKTAATKLEENPVKPDQSSSSYTFIKTEAKSTTPTAKMTKVELRKARFLSSIRAFNGEAVERHAQDKWKGVEPLESIYQNHLDDQTNTIASPYQPEHCAELQEKPFVALQRILRPVKADESAASGQRASRSSRNRRRLEPTQEAIDLLGLTAAQGMVTTAHQIFLSGIVWGSQWTDGNIRGVDCGGTLEPQMLLMCLASERFYRGEPTHTCTIIKSLNCLAILEEAIKHWGWEDSFYFLVYPPILVANVASAAPSSTQTEDARYLVDLRNRERGKFFHCILFCTRAYICEKKLKVPCPKRLKKKIVECLTYMHETMCKKYPTQTSVEAKEHDKRVHGRHFQPLRPAKGNSHSSSSHKRNRIRSSTNGDRKQTATNGKSGDPVDVIDIDDDAVDTDDMHLSSLHGDDEEYVHNAGGDGKEFDDDTSDDDSNLSVDSGDSSLSHWEPTRKRSRRSSNPSQHSDDNSVSSKQKKKKRRGYENKYGPIEQFCLETGKTIRTFDTALNAIRSLDTREILQDYAIYRVLKGRIEHWKGYGWRSIGNGTTSPSQLVAPSDPPAVPPNNPKLMMYKYRQRQRDKQKAERQEQQRPQQKRRARPDTPADSWRSRLPYNQAKTHSIRRIHRPIEKLDLMTAEIVATFPNPVNALREEKTTEGSALYRCLAGTTVSWRGYFWREKDSNKWPEGFVMEKSPTSGEMVLRKCDPEPPSPSPKKRAMSSHSHEDTSIDDSASDLHSEDDDVDDDLLSQFSGSESDSESELHDVYDEDNTFFESIACDNRHAQKKTSTERGGADDDDDSSSASEETVYPMPEITDCPYLGSSHAEVQERMFETFLELVKPVDNDAKNPWPQAKAIHIFGQKMASSLVLVHHLIGASGMFYSFNWSKGMIRGTDCGDILDSVLLLSLYPRRMTRHSDSLLRCITVELKVTNAVQSFLQEWKMDKTYKRLMRFEGHYKFARRKPANYLCSLFVARVYHCAKLFQLKQLDRSIRKKVKGCLRMMTESLDDGQRISDAAPSRRASSENGSPSKPKSRSPKRQSPDPMTRRDVQKICLETGAVLEVFPTPVAAMKEIKVKNPHRGGGSQLYMCLRHEKMEYKGFGWRYAIEDPNFDPDKDSQPESSKAEKRDAVATAGHSKKKRKTEKQDSRAVNSNGETHGIVSIDTTVVVQPAEYESSSLSCEGLDSMGGFVPEKSSRSRPVEQICPNTGNVIARFLSPKAVMQALGVTNRATHLYEALGGKIAHWRGFRWRYVQVKDEIEGGKTRDNKDKLRTIMEERTQSKKRSKVEKSKSMPRAESGGIIITKDKPTKIRSIVPIEDTTGVPNPSKNAAAWKVFGTIDEVTTSPYEEDRCAEIGEELFETMKELLQPVESKRHTEASSEASNILGATLANSLVKASHQIALSGMVYGSEWRHGKVRDKSCGFIPKAMLLLCLQGHRFARPEAYKSGVLTRIIADLGLSQIVRSAIEDWKIEGDFENLLSASTTFSYLTEVADCQRCEIFVARTYRVVKALRRKTITASLMRKVTACLARMESSIKPQSQAAELPPESVAQSHAYTSSSHSNDSGMQPQKATTISAPNRGTSLGVVEQVCPKTQKVLAVFRSPNAATLAIAGKSGCSGIYKCLRRMCDSWKGFHWRYVDDAKSGNEDAHDDIETNDSEIMSSPSADQEAGDVPSPTSMADGLPLPSQSLLSTLGGTLKRTKTNSTSGAESGKQGPPKQPSTAQTKDSENADDAEDLEESDAAYFHYSGEMVYPGEEEIILNAAESELAWLCEESLYALRKRTVQWGFVWQYASPNLRIELLKLPSSIKSDGDQDKVSLLVRMHDDLVARRWPAKRREVRRHILRGEFRSAMGEIITNIHLEARGMV